MFKNIGGKIKVLAQVQCWIGIVISVLCGISAIATSLFAVNLGSSILGWGAAAGRYGALSAVGGILIAVVGSLLSWISSFVLYGFGELIVKTTEIANNTQRNLADEQARSLLSMLLTKVGNIEKLMTISENDSAENDTHQDNNF